MAETVQQKAELARMFELVEEFTAGCGDQVQLECNVSLLLTLIGQLQLALRHPRNVGPSSLDARNLVNKLIGQVEARSPELAEFLRRGDDPSHDVH